MVRWASVAGPAVVTVEAVAGVEAAVTKVPGRKF